MLVAVIQNGGGSEEEVSARSASAIGGALVRLGHSVVTFPYDANLPFALQESKPDAAFPACHGGLGEGGGLQALLELFGFPYVGSGPSAAAAALDKWNTRLILQAGQVPVAPGLRIADPMDESAARQVVQQLGRDLVVKPVSQGSSVGVSFPGPGDLVAQCNAEIIKNGSVLVEQRVSGAEHTVAVLESIAREPAALPVIQISTPDGEWYDYAHRYTSGLSLHKFDIPPQMASQLKRLGIQAHQLLGCRHLSRTDFIVTDSGEIVALETNTLPGFTSTSLYPDASLHAGIAFDDLVGHLLGLALGHTHSCGVDQVLECR